MVIYEHLSDFLEEFDNRSQATKLLYRKTIDYFIVWLIKEGANETPRNVLDPKKRDAVAYRNYLRDKKLSANTIDNYVASCRKFYKWLNMEQRGYEDIFQGMKWDRDKIRALIKCPLTLKQVYQLIASFDRDTILGARNSAIIFLMCFTGLWCIDVSRLTFQDIVTGETGTRLQIMRKGNRSKSGVITLTDDMLKELNRYWNFRADPMGPESPLFVNHAHRSKDTPLTPVCISRIVKQALRRIGLNSKKYSAHALRHTAATLAVLAGAELWEVGQMLGHSNLRQTESYVHLLGFDLGQQGHAISKIEQYAKKYRKSHNKARFLI